jgi:hypothetical protein
LFCCLEAEVLAIVERAALRDWRAARWLLERLDRAGPPLQEPGDPLAEIIDIAKRRAYVEHRNRSKS